MTRQQAVAVAFADADRRVRDLPDELSAIVLGTPNGQWGSSDWWRAGSRTDMRGQRSSPVSTRRGEGLGALGPGRAHGARARRGGAALLRYGGHALAAGFSLDAANFGTFNELVCAAVAEQLGDAPRERVFSVDAVVNIADLTPELCEVLAHSSPADRGITSLSSPRSTAR